MRGWPISRAHRVQRMMTGVGVDTERFRPGSAPSAAVEALVAALGPEPRGALLTCVGELNDNKRQRLIVDCLPRLSPDVHLLLVGEGPCRPQLRARAEALAVADRVHFSGHVDDVRPALELSDVVLLTSAREGLPVSLMEALASGVPIVVTPTRGSQDLAKMVGCPVAETADADALARAIDEALADPRSRDEVRTAFLSQWDGGSKQAVTTSVVDLLERTIAERGDR